jgi:hypothetical protein
MFSDVAAQSGMCTTASSLKPCGYHSVRIAVARRSRPQHAADPDYAQGLHSIIQRLNGGDRRPSALDDVVSQPWARDRFDWYDAAAQYEVALHMQARWCAIAAIRLGAAPGRDRQVEHNQPSSTRCLPRSGRGAPQAQQMKMDGSSGTKASTSCTPCNMTSREPSRIRRWAFHSR